MSRILLVALFLGVASTASAQPTAADVLNAVDKAYASVKTTTLDFQQTVTYATFGGSKKTSGQMWVERPGKLRWEYQQTHKGQTKPTKIFVTDGKTVTMIDKPNLTVDHGPICGNITPAAMSFLTGQGTLAAEFVPSIVATTKTTIELELTPIQPTTQYDKLVVTVDATTYAIQKSSVNDRAGNINEFAFSNVNNAATIKTSSFKVNLKALRKAHYKVTTHAGSCPTTGAAAGSGTGTASGSNTSTE